MNLKKIKIQNFKKIGSEVTFKIKPGLNLIKSEINGTGKTTLLSAITFLLWNKNGDTKGNSKTTLSVNELINDVNKKELLVEGYFDNGYIIRRGLKPNIFEILDENGNNLADRSSKTIDQNFLETELLGYNYETFMSTIFLNSKPNSIPFIYMSNTQRKEYIEKILDLRVIYYLNESLKTKISNNKAEIQNCSKSIEWNKDNLNVLTAELERQKQVRENQKLEIQNFLKNKENQIQMNLINIQNIDEAINAIKSKNLTLTENLKNKTFTDKLNENIILIENEIELLKKDETHIMQIKELNDSKINISQEIDSIKNTLNTDIDNMNILKNDLEKLELNSTEYNESELKNALVLINNKIQELKNELLKKETEKNIYLKNKDNYLACGDCLTLTKIIGGFNFDEYDDFVPNANLSIEKLNLKHKEIQTKLEEMTLLKSKIDNLKNQISTLNNDINTKQNSITKNESEINNIDYKVKDLELSIDKKIQDKENQILNIKKDIDNIKEKIELIIENNNKEIQDKETQIQNINLSIEGIRAQTAPALIEINEEPLKDCQNKISELQLQYDLLNEQKVELDELKENINNKNIKEQALKTYIPVFEEKVNSLISRFTEDDMFTIKAKLTDDFDIEFTKNGKSLNMFSLSEGQKASITFAFTFAFQFLLDTKNQIKESTLFIDEILDIALSSGRLNTIIEYLKEVSTGNKSVYIISHNPNLQLELFDNIIDVSIENGFSKYTFSGNKEN